MHPLVATFLASLCAAQAQTAWTPELTFRFQSVSQAVPSNDGRLAAWVETRHVMDTTKSEQKARIWVGRTDGSRRYPLTAADDDASHPAFSPDGRYVFFQSARSGKANLWRIALDGGEAQRITDWTGSLGAFQLSPDGKWIAFAATDRPAVDEQAVKEKRDFRVIDENPRNHALWVIAAEPGAAAPRRLTNPARHVAEFDWWPDSHGLAFESRPTPSPDEWVHADIAEVNAESGAEKMLAATRRAEYEPRCSPDGRYIAFLNSSDPAHWPGDARMALIDRRTGSIRELAPTPDERPRMLGWAQDSSKIYFGETRATHGALYAMPLDGPPAEIYQPKRGTFFAGYDAAAQLSANGRNIAFAEESAAVAPEAYATSLEPFTPVRVSEANTAVAAPGFGETKTIRWKSKDGTEVEGLLTTPAGYSAGKRYPLILNIHGGPANVFADMFLGKAGVYPLAVFASKGYVILRPNPRGSAGYGKRFRFANLNDWGGGDYEDIMAGVDHLIATGVADADRMAVMGWSYGGFMTSWIVTHTKRFKAAVIGAAVTNLWSFTGTADIPGFLPDYFNGEPWDAFERYRLHSPMSFVKGVATPSLILHGEADERVPISQGYELYNALKRQGVPAKMVVYPRTPHGPKEPKFLLDIMERHLDWVERYVPRT